MVWASNPEVSPWRRSGQSQLERDPEEAPKICWGDHTHIPPGLRMPGGAGGHD